MPGKTKRGDIHRGALKTISKPLGLLIQSERRQRRACVVSVENCCLGTFRSQPVLAFTVAQLAMTVELGPSLCPHIQLGALSGEVSVSASLDGAGASAPSAMPTSTYIIPRPPACSSKRQAGPAGAGEGEFAPLPA